MSFDISKLTNAVNRYLNSLSEISNAARRSSEEIASRAQFSADLKDAIAQNMQSRLRNDVTIPDISEEVKTAISSATGSIDNTIQQINGSFEAIREAGQKTSVSGGKAIDTSSAPAAASKTSTNSDAYNGLLSTEALQELSRSQYFSANLLQKSLLDTNKDEEEEDENSLSLSSLNTKSLLANSLTSTDSLKDAIEAVSTSASDSSDLAKALIKAYSNGGTSLMDTSVFGDFTL